MIPGRVYVLRGESSGLIKVGHVGPTVDAVSRRARRLACQTGEALTLVASWPGPVAVEHAIHITLRAATSARGSEWFHPTSEVMAWLASLPAAVRTHKTYRREYLHRGKRGRISPLPLDLDVCPSPTAVPA